MIAFAQEVASRGAQSEAAFAQDHAGAGGLGWAGPLVVLQLREVGGVAVGDELQTQKIQNRFLLAVVLLELNTGFLTNIAEDETA